MRSNDHHKEKLEFESILIVTRANPISIIINLLNKGELQ